MKAVECVGALLIVVVIYRFWGLKLKLELIEATGSRACGSLSDFVLSQFGKNPACLKRVLDVDCCQLTFQIMSALTTLGDGQDIPSEFIRTTSVTVAYQPSAESQWKENYAKS